MASASYARCARRILVYLRAMPACISVWVYKTSASQMDGMRTPLISIICYLLSIIY